MNLKLRSTFVIIISLVLLLGLIIGIGVVDNSIKIAQENPFLNKIYINKELNFAYLRYLNLSLKIPFGFDYFKPLLYGIIISFYAIKSMIIDTLLKIF